MVLAIEEAPKESQCGEICHKNLQDYVLSFNPRRAVSLLELHLYFLYCVLSQPSSSSSMEIEIDPTSAYKLKDTWWGVRCYQCVEIPQRLWRVFANVGIRERLLFNSPPNTDEYLHSSWSDHHDALKDGRNSVSIGKSRNTYISKINKVKSSLKKKRGKVEKKISLKDLEPFFSGSLMEAAKSLGVSRSTLKRKCRQLGISKWPSFKGNKHHSRTSTNKPQFAFGPQVADNDNIRTSVQPNTINECRSFDVLPKYKRWSYNTQTRSSVQMNKGLSRKKKMAAVDLAKQVKKHSQYHVYYPASTQPEVVVPSQSTRYDETRLGGIMASSTVKATYKEDMTRFGFSLKSNVVDLKTEIATRLSLDLGTFKLKYWDDDDEWALIACESDWQDCVWISKSFNKYVIRLLVQDL